MKKVVFLLPHFSDIPIGGYQVVYEYANQFARAGYHVTIVYPAALLTGERSMWEPYKVFIHFLKCLSHKAQVTWFELDPRIRLQRVWNLSKWWLPHAEAYFATAAETAIYLNEYHPTEPAQKFYLIQGYEEWFLSRERLFETYRAPMHKIVIASWLQKIVAETGQTATLIYDGLDFKRFTQTIAPAKKDKYLITMLYHSNPLKGASDGIAALQLVKARFPQLRASFFGTPPSPNNLPEWITYYRKPDPKTHNHIYNESAVFIAPSHSEGFGLTVGEAMICGCAVACSDNLGHTEITHGGKTALLSPVGNPEAMAQNIIRLIEDDQLRYKLAEQATQFVQTFTWEKSFAKLKALVENSLKNSARE